MKRSESLEPFIVNPFLPLTEYIPDGEPHVFGDRVYLYGSHDRFGGDHYCMNDYVCYSAHIRDLTRWRYEGVIYRRDQDPRNGDHTHYLWAPDVVRGLDGRYYLYYCMDVLPEIGVAVSQTPAGQYEYLGLVRYEDGTPLGRKPGDYIQFDPGIFIDDDNRIYLYSGNGPRYRADIDHTKDSQVMQLHQDMMTVKDRPVSLIPTLENSLGTGFEGHEFYEASSIRKINGRYYVVYSDVQSFSLCYAVSRYPDRDYTFGGQLIALGDVGYQGRSVNAAQNFLGNIHGGIEMIHGQWYVFYHRQTNGTKFSRQACAEKIEILADGSIPQVEMTSCGLNQGPLLADGAYMAAIACNLWSADGVVYSDSSLVDERYPYFTQMGDDGAEDAIPYIANMRRGSAAGYKYFQFHGVEEIFVTTGGTAKGCLLVLTEPDGKPAGRIDIFTDGNGRTVSKGRAAIPDGVWPLYFRYEGDGELDFYAFEFRGKEE